MNPNQPTLTSFPELGASPSLLNGQDSKPSPSVKSTPTAKRSSKRGLGQLTPTLRANDAEKRGNVADDARNGITAFVQHSIPTYVNSTDEDTAELTCLQQEFHASQPARPGSAEARKTTVGSGRKLYEFLVKHSRLSQFSKTLLESLLLSQEWSSSLCFLEWKASATKSRRRLLFQLVAWEPDTFESESSLLPTLNAGNDHSGYTMDEFGGSNNRLRRLTPTLQASDSTGYARKPDGKRGANLKDIQGTNAALWPTLAARDYRSPNAQSYQDRTGTTKGEQLPNFVGLKLTSAFCERYMGFPANWTAVPESMRSGTASSRRKSTRSSKRSAR